MTNNELYEQWRARFRRHPVRWIIAAVFALFVVVGAIGNATAHKKASSEPDSAVETTVAAASTPTPPPKVKHSVPQSKKDALAYVKQFSDDMSRVDADAVIEETALLAFSKSETEAKLQALAVAAQRAHDSIDSIRQDFALGGQVSDSSRIGDAEVNIFDGANDLKNAEGQLVAVTNSPTSAGVAAQFKVDWENASHEWNSGVRTIYRLAYGTAKDAPAV